MPSAIRLCVSNFPGARDVLFVNQSSNITLDGKIKSII